MKRTVMQWAVMQWTVMKWTVIKRTALSRVLWHTLARALRRTALPLAVYYAVTLGVPLANGAARSGGAFIEHALIVAAIPLVLIVLACAIHTAAHANLFRIGSNRAPICSQSAPHK